MGDSEPGAVCLGWETLREQKGGPSGGRLDWARDSITSITGDHSREERSRCGEGRKNHRM